MQKVSDKWWVIAAIMLGVIYGYGHQKMFFHQDDLDWLILANKSWGGIIAAPIGDHINYLWRLLLKSEWELFGLNFPAYLTVSVALHGMNVWLLYQVARRIGNESWARLAALIMSVNTNWTETVLWMSGQTILITATLVLLANWARSRKKWQLTTLALASLTSALALGTVVASGLIDGIDWTKKKLKRVGVGVGIVVGWIALIYLTVASDGTELAVSGNWVVKVIGVMGLAIVNTAVGRAIIPFDRLEMVRIVGVAIAMVGLGWKYRARLGEWRQDSWVQFLSVQILAYYLIVAVGRAQYGLGIMRAERYAYIGLALILLLGVRLARTVRVKTWMLVGVLLIVTLQSWGLWVRAEQYIRRPTQMRMLFEQIINQEIKTEMEREYLPHFVLNDERLKYGDIKILFEH